MPGDVVRPSACGAAGVADPELAATAGAGAADGAGSARFPSFAGAGVGAATAALTSVSSRATTAFTGTVSPSFTRISASTPALTAWTSESTLSVEISKIVSSRFTASPTFLNHLVSVPSASDSPIEGIRTSIRATGRKGDEWGAMRKRGGSPQSPSLIVDDEAPITVASLLPESCQRQQS